MWSELCKIYSPDAELQNKREYKIYYDIKAAWICEVYNGFGCKCVGQGLTPKEALNDAIRLNKQVI